MGFWAHSGPFHERERKAVICKRREWKAWGTSRLPTDRLLLLTTTHCNIDNIYVSDPLHCQLGNLCRFIVLCLRTKKITKERVGLSENETYISYIATEIPARMLHFY